MPLWFASVTMGPIVFTVYWVTVIELPPLVSTIRNAVVEGLAMQA
jgi:hypothetical protein